ncbi:MAG: aminotransferase class V-fold PLP-dependent enzyme [Thermoanaerobaculia bacterium]
MPSERLAERQEIDRWRSEFSLPAYSIYLNHAAVSPLPFRVLSAVDSALREAAPGVDQIWLYRLAQCDRVRESAARLMGARNAHEIAFVPNTSTGLSYVAEGLAWDEGDNVVTAESEFPSNVYPWLGLLDRGVDVRRVREVDGRISLEVIERAMSPRTRVVALSWVQYATGFRLDLAAVAKLCWAHDALLVVDAIQGLGALPLAVSELGVDVCVAGSHKWLLGGEGIGLLYVSDRVLDRLKPVIRGWLSVDRPFDPVSEPMEFARGASRFEPGTMNVAGIYGLGAAIEWLLDIGPDRIGRRVLALAKRAETGLARLGFDLAAAREPGSESGIVSAEHCERTATALRQELAKRDIQVADRQERLRISAHFYNTEDEIDACLSAIAELV